MSEMGKMVTLTGDNHQEIFNLLINNDIIVQEDIQGSKLLVNYDGEKFNFRAKSLNSENMNMIDLALQNYYNKGIEYFNNLDIRIKSLMSKKWWFCFEYFPDNQPANILYSRIPKNNLVLTCIIKSGKYNFNLDELSEYARLFDTDIIPVIYKGRLNNKMIEAIKYFINTSEEDLEFIFGEKSFSYFFYKLLNPLTTNSFLMNNGEYQDNLQRLIIKTSSGDITIELLNPLYKRLSGTNSTEFTEIYTLILVNFLIFCQTVNIKDIKLKSKKRDEIYIELICNLYNVYLNEIHNDLINFDFTIPDFFDKDKFKINIELITNKTTKKYIRENDKFEYIFKVILGSFNKKKVKPIGIFNEQTLVLFNNFVQEISDYIDTIQKKSTEIELQKQGLLNFKDYFDLKYDTDGAGQIYPDVYNEFETGISDKKKKK